MGLEYDFDIVTIAQDEVEPAQADTEASQNGKTRARALFRDFQTAEALRDTSPNIRKMFVDAGFDFETRNSSLPNGIYRAEDEDLRNLVIQRLFANIKATGLAGEYCGEFDLWAFLNGIKTARPQGKRRRKPPIQLLPYIQPEPESAPQPVPPKRRTLPWRIGIALGLAVLMIILLRFLAAAGATP